MRCIACGRPLLKPAYTAPERLGGWMLGPKCLEKAGLKKRRSGALYGAPKPRKARPAKQRPVEVLVLPGQMALWAG
jgi:hypothetical protein